MEEKFKHIFTKENGLYFVGGIILGLLTLAATRRR